MTDQSGNTAVIMHDLSRYEFATAEESQGKCEREVWHREVPESLRAAVREHLDYYWKRPELRVVGVKVRCCAGTFRVELRRPMFSFAPPDLFRAMLSWTGGRDKATTSADVTIVIVECGYSSPLIDTVTVTAERKQ